MGADVCSNGVFFLSAWADIEEGIYPLNRTCDMFFPPKRQTIIAVFVAITTVAISTQAMAWQSSEFERRAAAMQAARARSSQSLVVPASASRAIKAKKANKTIKTVAQPTSSTVTTRHLSPGQNVRVASAVVTNPSSVGTNQKPVRVAQIFHGGAPITGGTVIQGDIVGSSFAGGEIISEGPVYDSCLLYTSPSPRDRG